MIGSSVMAVDVAYLLAAVGRGNSPAEYEDALAADDAAGRYAVADGATEGCFTGLWARLLVEDFVQHAEPRRRPVARLRCPPCRSDGTPTSAAGELPVVRRAGGASKGAFATFLGVVLDVRLSLSEGPR